MQLTIKNKNKNLLLERTEVDGSVSFTGKTPSNLDLAEVLAKELKKDSSLIIIKNIYTEFGQQNAQFKAVAYDNKEAKNKNEVMTKHIKKKIEAAAKKVEEEKKSVEEAKQKEVEEKVAAVEQETKEKKSEETPTEDEPVEEVNKEEKEASLSDNSKEGGKE